MGYKANNYVLRIARFLLLASCAVFALSFIGGANAAIVGFLILIFIGVPAAGAYAWAHKRKNMHEDHLNERYYRNRE